jgi:hypothetical protein
MTAVVHHQQHGGQQQQQQHNKHLRKRRQHRRRVRRCRLWCNPPVVMLIIAGLGLLIIQLQLVVLQTDIDDGGSSFMNSIQQRELSILQSNNNEFNNQNDVVPAAAADAAASPSTTISKVDADAYAAAKERALQFRRQRLQDKINTTLFSEDDFVRISMLLQQQDSTNATTTTTTTKGYLIVDPDLKPILKILQNAGYKFLDHATFNALPTWSDVMGLYGPPKIYGLETCQMYRDHVPWDWRSLGPAGTFNTGTNLLSSLMATNCQMKPSKRNIARFLWQTPWGKHTPSQFIHNHTHTPKRGMKVSLYNNTLAVVTTRDPMTWIASMCIQNYAATYVHNKDQCPNLVPYPDDIQSYHNHNSPPSLPPKYTPVTVQYSQGIIQHHRSMADMWNEFYGDYVNLHIVGGANDEKGDNHKGVNGSIYFNKIRRALPGRLIVRLEDLIFHADQVVPQICECMGGTYHPDGIDGNIWLIPATKNQNVGVEDLDSNVTGVLRSIIKYGNPSKRLDKFRDIQQLQAAHELLNGTLMNLLGYPPVPVPRTVHTITKDKVRE